ncbi:uncharacterized protein METZ01_LOCUS296845 [marine metagenome]|uniref:phosphoribosylglycinamide formyltransferase 1 n=1 Tax=marine metagenome TaxID=408172 RepID=A0A382M9V0_9ZZZZ|tara:strand:- start:23 stop:625 length:603 start_codon:yes stop_codon:yes gene_type:complete
MAGIVVLLSGNGSNLQAIIDAGIPVKYVLSDNPDAYGLIRARNAGIPIQAVPSLKQLENFTTKVCELYEIKLIVLAGFMRILSPKFVQRWKSQIINIHPSLLPDFKGTSAIKEALDAGAKTTGVTIHYVDEGMDTGDIIEQYPLTILTKEEVIPLSSNFEGTNFAKHNAIDTLEQLSLRIHKIEHEHYPKVIKKLLKGKI